MPLSRNFWAVLVTSSLVASLAAVAVTTSTPGGPSPSVEPVASVPQPTPDHTATPDHTGTPGEASAPEAGLLAAKYKYEAPKKLWAYNSTKTTVELAWQTVTGSPGYVVKAVGGGQTLTQSMPSVSTYVFKGLKPGTKYTFNIAVEQPPSGSIKRAQLSPWSSAKASYSTSPAGYLNEPSGLRANETYAYEAALSWKAPAGYNPQSHKFRVDYALDQAMKSSAATAYIDGLSGRIAKLKANKNYYVRVRLVSKANNALVGDRSGFITIKTRTPMGAISGRLKAAAGVQIPLSRYVAVAYTASTFNVHEQVGVADDGSYSIPVQPGTYKVQLLYVGNKNYTSAWAKANTAGGRDRRSASSYKVAVSTTAKPAAVMPDVVVDAGATIKGKVVDVKGKPINNVYVSAVNNHSASADVLDQTMTNSRGEYTLVGISPGKVRIRANYSAEAFKNSSLNTTVEAKQAKTVGTIKLQNRNFMRVYKVWISKPVQTAVKTCVASRAYMAGLFPVARANNNKYQWYNGDKAIKGATGKCYTPRTKGMKLNVKVTYGRYGFNSKTGVSRIYPVK